MNELIFDRTQTDVTNRTWKGYYNTSDLNRVESWCRYLADELNSVGYSITITTKTNWTNTDMRTSAEMERIRTNIKKIMIGYHYTTTINTNADSFNYSKANNWEKILYEIYNLMFGMRNWYVDSGVANAGQNRLWQHRFRTDYTAPTITNSPAQYTPLLYIESDGSQYIDTGVQPYQTTTELLFEYLGASGSTSKNICACWNANNNRYYVLWANTTINCSVRDNTKIVLDSTINNKEHSIVYNDTNNKVKYDGVVVGTVSDLTVQSASTLFLFSMNYNGSYNPAKARIYSARIIDKSSNTILRDFIPVLDDNNVPCLYDKITKQFYYNGGTGTFNYSY